MKILFFAATFLTGSYAGAAQINATDGFGNPVWVSDDPYWAGDAPMGQPASKGYAANSGKGSGKAAGNTGVGASGRGSGGNGGGGTAGGGTGGGGTGGGGTGDGGTGGAGIAVELGLVFSTT